MNLRRIPDNSLNQQNNLLVRFVCNINEYFGICLTNELKRMVATPVRKSFMQRSYLYRNSASTKSLGSRYPRLPLKSYTKKPEHANAWRVDQKKESLVQYILVGIAHFLGSEEKWLKKCMETLLGLYSQSRGSIFTNICSSTWLRLRMGPQNIWLVQ
jgi:hypothetical protein